MQLALQTLIYRDTESNTLQPPENEGVIGAELLGSGFSALLHTPPFELPIKSGKEPGLPVSGIPLPSDGNTLPAPSHRSPATNAESAVVTAERQPQLSSFVDKLPSANSSAHSRPKGDFDSSVLPVQTGATAQKAATNLLSAKSGDIAGKIAKVQLAASADVRRLVTEAPRKPSDEARPLLVSQRPVAHMAAASLFTAESRSGVSPAISDLPDLIRIPSGTGERTPASSALSGHRSPADFQRPAGAETKIRGVPPTAGDDVLQQRALEKVALPPAGPREMSLSGPRPVIAPEPPVPGAEIGDKPSQQQNLLRGLPDTSIQNTGDKGPTDRDRGSRGDTAISAISKTHDRRVDTFDRASPELTTLNVPVKTRGTNPSLSLPPPPAHSTIAVVTHTGPNPAFSTAAMPAIATVDTPVLDPAWVDALQDRVLWLASRNIRTAEIRLNPAELGPLRVQISVEENSTHIAFSATHALTRDALENALPRLKDMFAESGMTLAGASVSDEGVAQRGNDANRGRAGEVGPNVEDSTQATSEQPTDRVPRKDPTSLVDTYA